LIRAHGVPPQKQQFFQQRGHEIIDGTCPKVKTVHKVIEKHRQQGFSIVIAGDKGHAEVIGLMGYAGDAGYLIQGPSDVEQLPELGKLCLVSQTTFDRDTFDKIAQALRNRFTTSEIAIKKTICAATDQRQTETAQLAKQVEALIVVGGKNSANTQRLAKVALDCGTPTQLVENENEINWDALNNCETIGITAGASTPNWMIKRITDYLQYMAHTRKRGLKNKVLRTLDILANLNVFLALGAVCMYITSSFLLGESFNSIATAVVFLYFFSMYLWNSLASIESQQHLGISRYQFYNAHKKLLFWASGIATLLLLSISYTISYSVFYLMFFSTLAGSIYHLTIVPKPLQKFFRYRNLKDIPTSRELFVSLAWATVLTFLPQAIGNTLLIRPSSIAVFCWIFVLAYLRSLIFDLRDIEGDRIMGRETLITIIGEKRARKALFIMTGICLLGLFILPALMGIGIYRFINASRFLLQVPVLLYAAFFVKWNPRINPNRSVLFNILTDSFFYLSALGAWIAAVVFK
jgi:4-hydroxy-3-methylbut-2-enyl diphosphate reductase